MDRGNIDADNARQFNQASQSCIRVVGWVGSGGKIVNNFSKFQFLKNLIEDFEICM